jgi:hypothetical protein
MIVVTLVTLRGENEWGRIRWKIWGFGEVKVGVGRLWDGHAVMRSMGEGGECSSGWDEMRRVKGDERKGSEGAVEGELGGRNWRVSCRGGSKAAQLG